MEDNKIDYLNCMRLKRGRCSALKYERKTKYYILSLLCVAILLVIFVMPVLADSEKEADEVLIVGIPVDRCPIFYPDPSTGEPVGIGVDLMRFAAAEAGYNTSFLFIREANLKEALDNDSYDLVIPFGSAITSASGQQIVVSDNLMQTTFTFVTRGNSDLPPMDHLRVGMVRSLGGAIETLGQLYPDMEISVYDTMDDFGSGYSSLHMLKEVPVDRIKLDLHFLTAAGDSEKCRTIVSCMINMVHLLGMEMIAEGVETIEQARFLDDQGCSMMQGYYFYKPMPVEEYEKLSEEI